MFKLLKWFLIVALLSVSITILAAQPGELRAQSEATPVTDSCPGSLPPRLTPYSSALVVPENVAELHASASADSEVLTSIKPYFALPVIGEPVCVESVLWWPVDYYDFDHENQYYTGWVAEGDQETYFLQPQPSNPMEFSISDEQASITVQYGGVSFEYNGALGKTVHALTIHAEKVSPGNGLPDVGEHLLFTFEDPDSESTRPLPTLAIYLTQDAPSLNSRASDQAGIIQTLLQQRPPPQALSRYMFEAEPKPELGVYPPRFEEQWFRAQHKYLTFQHGEGIRFVAMYSRVTPQATNDGLIYSAQAVSEDGKYLVSAVIPITFQDTAESDALLSQMTNLEFEAFQQKVQEYGAQIIEKMDQSSTTMFFPSLSDLDSLVTSLQIAESKGED